MEESKQKLVVSRRRRKAGSKKGGDENKGVELGVLNNRDVDHFYPLPPLRK